MRVRKRFARWARLAWQVSGGWIGVSDRLLEKGGRQDGIDSVRMIHRATGYGGTSLPAFHPVRRTRSAGWNCWCPPVLGYRTSSCLTLFPLRLCAFASLRSLLLVCLKHPNKTRGQSPRFFKHLLKFSRPSTYDHRDRPILMLRFQKSPSNSARALQLAKPRLANLQNEMLP